MKAAENENAFKHYFNAELLGQIARRISAHYAAFDARAFRALDLQPLEMKARVYLIRDELRRQLPDDYNRALKILVKSLNQGATPLEGFAIWPFTEFVQTYGLENPEASLEALKYFTTLFTSEWAVRPFIRQDPKATLAYLKKCAADPDAAVRRWASEGSRPRVPWGERLQSLIQDPSPTRPILERLKFDDELYVRKSVANHINDISKDHPHYVIDLLGEWKKAARGGDVRKIDWIIRHSLRTLIKAGHPGALGLIGVAHGAQVKLTRFELAHPLARLGGTLDFEVEIKSTADEPQPLVIDYVMHFMKSSGGTAPKVFKLRSLNLPARGTALIQKRHALKRITTREYYPGEQHLEIQVNGKILARKSWSLRTGSNRR